MGADASQAFARFWNGFIGLWAGGPAPRAAAVPVPVSVRSRASATISAPARVRASRAALENARAFPRLRAPNGVRSHGRATKKVPTEVETLDVTSGGDEGNPRTAAPSASASARVRASRAAPENARAFPRLRAPNGVRSPERVTKRSQPELRPQTLQVVETRGIEPLTS